jgi:hypothetical protein
MRAAAAVGCACAMDVATDVFTPEFPLTFVLVYALLLVGLVSCCCGCALWLNCYLVHYGPQRRLLDELVRRGVGARVGASAAAAALTHTVRAGKTLDVADFY